MTATILTAHDEHHEVENRDLFGFWLYILSDCLLFSILFATYAILHNNVYGGPSIKELSSLPYVFAETMLLLCSSFTYGLAVLSLNKLKNQKRSLLIWLGLTFILGFSFVVMEGLEFMHLCQEGHSWQSSASLSSFFTLVGTHGLHVSVGLFWMLMLMGQLCFLGITPTMKKRLSYLGMFWTFLDIVWIFVFTLVYLMGAV